MVSSSFSSYAKTSPHADDPVLLSSEVEVKTHVERRRTITRLRWESWVSIRKFARKEVETNRLFALAMEDDLKEVRESVGRKGRSSEGKVGESKAGWKEDR